MSAFLTNAEIAGLRTYFKSKGFKYPAEPGDDLPPGWKETWGMIYFNALPRLLEEVLQRRFHLRYNEADKAMEPMPCGVMHTSDDGVEMACELPVGHEFEHYYRPVSAKGLPQ